MHYNYNNYRKLSILNAAVTCYVLDDQTWKSKDNKIYDNRTIRQIKRHGDGAGNTVEENSSIFSLIQMR